MTPLFSRTTAGACSETPLVRVMLAVCPDHGRFVLQNHRRDLLSKCLGEGHARDTSVLACSAEPPAGLAENMLGRGSWPRRFLLMAGWCSRTTGKAWFRPMLPTMLSSCGGIVQQDCVRSFPPFGCLGGLLAALLLSGSVPHPGMDFRFVF